MIKCPQCDNTNGATIQTFSHRREQMECICDQCHHAWTEVFKDVPKEVIKEQSGRLVANPFKQAPLKRK